MSRLRALLSLLALMTTTIVVTGGPAAAHGNEIPGAEQFTGTVTGQAFRDGPNGTVFTLTELETDDVGPITIETHGGIHSSGIGQYTSHEARFLIGARYRVEVVARRASAGTYPTVCLTVASPRLSSAASSEGRGSRGQTIRPSPSASPAGSAPVGLQRKT